MAIALLQDGSARPLAPGAHHLILIFPNSHALARNVKNSASRAVLRSLLVFGRTSSDPVISQSYGLARNVKHDGVVVIG